MHFQKYLQKKVGRCCVSYLADTDKYGRLLSKSNRRIFLPSHPLGAVIDSKSTYGIGLRLYNGVLIGPYGIDGKPPSEWVHPVIRDGVILYAHSKVYGKTVIGNNVTVSPGTVIVNEDIPDTASSSEPVRT